MAHLSMRFLGSFQATLDDVAVSGFDSDKTRALLVYLVVEAERPQRREKLAALLWPNVLDASARRSLSQALFNLRQILGDSSDTGVLPYLSVGRDSIQFNGASAYTLDVACFLTLQGGASLETLTEAAAFYGGDFLQGFNVADAAGFDEWVVVQRERLHRCAMVTLEKLAALHEQAHNHDGAIEVSERLLALEPWREETHQQLMRLMAHSGQRSRALAQYESCKRYLAGEFGIEPSPLTQQLYEQIRAGQGGGSAKAPESKSEPEKGSDASRPGAIPSTLPLYLTPFIGREREVADVKELLEQADARLITLTGHGGMGKTRLAVQAAGAEVSAFRHGVLFVPLVAATSLAALIAEFSERVNLTFSGASEPKSQLLHYLRDKQMLVVLDNFESLLWEAPEVEEEKRGKSSGESGRAIDFVLELLAAAPQVKVLITSREPLNVPGEWLVEVRGLGSAATTLFVQTAERSQRAFAPAAGDKSVDEICHLVEQMPLAIELAAGWVQTLSCAEIASEIRRDLSFLVTSSRGIAERHRSMQAVFDQTWAMLPEAAQQAMARLSLFRSGVQRAAAAQVAGVDLTMLPLLVSKSLLRLTGEGRYQIHELMRQYAAGRLAADPQMAAESYARFCAYYADLLAEAAPRLRGPQQRQALSELKSEWENLHTAWSTMITQRHLAELRRSFTAISSLHEVRGLFAEGATFCAQVAQLFGEAVMADARQEAPAAVTLADKIAAQGQALAMAGWFQMRLGKHIEARTLLEKSRQLVADLPGQRVLSTILNNLAVVSWHLGEHEEALRYGEEGVALYRQKGDTRGVAVCLSNMANPYLSLNANQEAYRVAHEAVDGLRAVGDLRGAGFALMKLGQAAFRLGQNGEAEAWLEESIRLSRSIGYAWQEGAALHLLGAGLLQAGEASRAATILQAGVDAFRSVGDEPNVALVQSTLAEALTQLQP